MVEHPGPRRPPVGFAVLLGGPLGGVEAQQVVECVPVGGVLFDQVGAGEPIEQARSITTDQGAADVDGEITSRYERQQAKQPPGRFGEPGVGQVERGAHSAQLIAVHLQRGQPVARAQLVDVVGDPPVRVLAEVGGGDPQRQRQIAAQAGQLRGGDRLARHPLVAPAACSDPADGQ